jgi:hypothetical protein
MVGDQPFKEPFPKLSSIAHCKEVWVMDKLQFSMVIFNECIFYKICIGLGGRFGD